MELKKFIIQQVERLSASNGYTQEAMAAVCDLSTKASFNKRILGHTSFKNEELVAIAKEFDKDINYFLNQNYEQEQKELQELKESAPKYGGGDLHDPTERTITISVDIPISGGIKIPEDLNERIRLMILNSK
jgi:transcriptional regulator with XRE-family HTH domain